MITSLKDILVVSDLDGTLLTAKEGIPGCNTETIKLFCSLGGRFTVATGRSIQSAKAYLKSLDLNLPVILYNGGVIYDYAQGEPLCYCELDNEISIKAITDILDNFPQLGVEIMTNTAKTYLVNSNETTHEHLSREKFEYISARIQDVPDNWYKVLFASNAHDQQKLLEFLQTKDYNGIYFTATSPNYLEMLPQGINKGIALKKLCSLLTHPIENTFAIGDYYNDIEMLELAGTGVAVANAITEVKLKADIHTDSCQDGGVAQFLYSLIKQYT